MKAALFFILFFCFSLDSCEESQDFSQAVCVDDLNLDFFLKEGELALFQGQLLEAETFFTQVIDLCDEQRENQRARLCRALFNRAVTHACLDLEERALSDLSPLEALLKSFHCTKIKSNTQDQEYMAGGKPIYGPDEISFQDCIDLVNNTSDFIKDILSLTPIKFQWKASVLTATRAISDQAKKCCRSCGVWKACLQPLYEKWLNLKDWDRECRRDDYWHLPPVD